MNLPAESETKISFAPGRGFGGGWVGGRSWGVRGEVEGGGRLWELGGRLGWWGAEGCVKCLVFCWKSFDDLVDIPVSNIVLRLKPKLRRVNTYMLKYIRIHTCVYLVLSLLCWACLSD